MSEKLCECCGAKLVEYKHSLSKGLAQCLYYIVMAGPGEHELNDLKLTYSQRSNFSKLKYWGLVEKVGDPKGKGGKWILTSDGHLFVTGMIKLRKSVWTFRDQVVRFEGDNIVIKDITDGWEYRPNYAQEAVVH